MAANPKGQIASIGHPAPAGNSNHVPLIIRGRVIEADEATFGGRHGGVVFTTPDVKKYMSELVLTTPSSLNELYELRFDDILDYLAELGVQLEFNRNRHLQEAFAVSVKLSGLTEPLLRHCYRTLGQFFDRELVRDSVDNTIGIPYLDGWVERQLYDGSHAAVRAFGARAVHIVAGNVPGVSALTILRNAVTRSDAIIKTPSNDPLTAMAIAQTMIDMAPDHPLTKHLSVAYWKGGDAAVEDLLYRPRNIEKIIAWGGVASVSHIVKYVQPGIDLITLDPKLSSTIIGTAAFRDESTMRIAAKLLAMDIGAFNQEGCLNARVVYVETGTDDAGIEAANQFGAQVYEEINALPPHFSGPADKFDEELAGEIESLRLGSEWYKIYGGGRAGAIIVSQMDEPVDFADRLAHRVANIVPVGDLGVPLGAVTAYTQTIGIYPDELKSELRHKLALAGAQRIVCLGGAAKPVFGGPQDAIEPLRRMCKWIIDETRDAAQLHSR